MNLNKELFTKAFTGIGVFVVTILIIWGAVNTAKLIPSALTGLSSAAVTLTSVFIPGEERIILSPSNNVVDINEPFTLTFEHTKNNDSGNYSLTYNCVGDLVFEIGNGEYTKVACDTPLDFTNTELRIIPISSVSRFLDTIITITYTKDDGSKITGSTTITVVNEDVTNSKEVITPTVTEGERTDIIVPISGSTNFSDPNGRVDLAARVISTGIVDIETNEYTATDTITSRDRVGLRFEVENLGTKASGTWDFTTVLPTQTIYFYNSESQRSLNPGDRIEFTIGFDGVKTSNPEIVINVDPGGYIGESNEENNILRYPIEITVVE